MFYYDRWFGTNGRLRAPWAAAWNLNHHQQKTDNLPVNISHICDDIKEVVSSNSDNFKHVIALRTSAQLISGLCQLHKNEIDKLWKHCIYDNSTHEDSDNKIITQEDSENDEELDCASYDGEIEAVRRNVDNEDDFINEALPVFPNYVEQSNLDYDKNVPSTSKQYQPMEVALLENMSPVKMISHESPYTSLISVDEPMEHFSEEIVLEEVSPEDLPVKKKRKICAVDRHKSFSSAYVRQRSKLKNNQLRCNSARDDIVNMRKTKRIHFFSKNPSFFGKNASERLKKNTIRNLVTNRNREFNFNHSYPFESHNKSINISDELMQDIEETVQLDMSNKTFENSSIVNHCPPHFTISVSNDDRFGVSENSFEINCEQRVASTPIETCQNDGAAKNHKTIYLYRPKTSNNNLEHVIIKPKLKNNQLKVGSSFNQLKNIIWNDKIGRKIFKWRNKWNEYDLLKKLNTLWLERKTVALEDIVPVGPKKMKTIIVWKTLYNLIMLRKKNYVFILKNEGGNIVDIIPNQSFTELNLKYRKFSLLE